MDFSVFGIAVRKRFEALSDEQLFVVDVDGSDVWERYLSSFPHGTNKIFRVRGEYDCACCRNFVKNIGNVVAIQNGALSTVWDVSGLPETYQTVADLMSIYIRSLPIKNVFLPKMDHYGSEKTYEEVGTDRITWNHFYTKIPNRYLDKEIGLILSKWEGIYQVFTRGLKELKPDAVETVLDLIKEKQLYRGEEHKNKVEEFQRIQNRYYSIDNDRSRDILVWSLIKNFAARFRSEVIGTLVEDLSKDFSLEEAVGRFESKVAPQNFSRSSAPITPKMIKVAMDKIRELNLEDALERRHARFSDVSINSVLFVDNAIRKHMKGSLEDLLMEEVKPVEFDESKAEEISIDDFIKNVLPRARTVNLYLENRHTPNFMSLTAPVHEDVKGIFKWKNNFAWSYEGNVTDSIKERVKRAGGMVEGVAMRVSLAWYNTDDLDLHIFEPNGNHISFMNRGDIVFGGYLDVDMNVHNYVRNAIENIRWKNRPKDGEYRVAVNNYTHRESIDVGFTLEVEGINGISTFTFNHQLKNKETIGALKIIVKNGVIDHVVHATDIKAGNSSNEVWGLKTQNMIRVNSIVLSPNYWDEPGIGNKHWFFILDQCRNPNPTRGIYNEFLSGELYEHRKVLEVLADKTKCPVIDNQMSGLGFSSTKKESVSVVVTGSKLYKAYTVMF